MPQDLVLTDDRVIGRAEGQVSAEVDGEIVLLSVAQGKYYGLDEIGSDIWRRLEDRVRVGELCGSLASDYDAPLETIRQDVFGLLEALHREDLIEVAA